MSTDAGSFLLLAMAGEASVFTLLLMVFGAAYVVGATPFGYLAGRFKGIDIREHGSGNIGATNVLRILGKKVGVPVFILDVLKGVAPVVAAQVWAANAAPPPTVEALAPSVAAVGTIVGHNFTFWLGFRGGKGVATSAGALLPLLPVAIAVAVLLWLAVFFTTRFVALASIAAGLIIPVVVAVRAVLERGWRWPELALACLIAVMVVVRHRVNIQRLRAGTEHRFARKRKTHQPPE